VPQDGRAKPADKPAEKAAPNPATTDSAAQTDRTAAQPPTNLVGNGGGNSAGNGAGQGGQQRPAPGAEAIPAATATAPAGEADPLSPLQTLSTLPAHAAAHYAARPADDGAGRLPAAQLANPLVRVVENGGGEFRIDLMPDDLGPVRVVAEVHGGRVALTIQAEHADTLSLLRRDIHHLERALSDAGFELDGGNLQFSLRGDDQPRGFASFGQGSGDQGTGANRMARHEESAQASAPPERAAVPIDGLVDITV